MIPWWWKALGVFGKLVAVPWILSWFFLGYLCTIYLTYERHFAFVLLVVPWIFLFCVQIWLAEVIGRWLKEKQGE